MASKPNIKGGNVVTFVIKVDGKPVPSVVDCYAIEIEKHINKIPRCVLTIRDGDSSTGKFSLSSSGTFVPGKAVTVEIGYNTKNEVVFQGVITGQSIQVNSEMGSSLQVECRDKAIKMAVGRKSKTYAKQKDSDIMTSLIKAAGLQSSVTATTTKWEEQVQYYATDWDYVLTRAEANGLIVITDQGKVTVGKPGANSKSVLAAEYGYNLLSFNCDLNAVDQLSKVQASAWDYKTQKVVNGSASHSYAGAGNLSPSKLADVIGLSEYDLQTSATLPGEDLTNWSKAEMVKSEYAKIQGEVTILGTSKVNPGNYITLSGVGDRFNGDVIVSGVTHTVQAGQWQSQFSVGISGEWFSSEPDVMAPPASGLLPGARGLFNATVKKMYEDPDNQYRVLVNIPLFDPNGKGLWARLSNFYATSGAGAFFLPEVGDEVVVGFLDEDPRFPIILGSLYSSSKIKPYDNLKPADKNPKKAIVSKKKMYIEFDDEDVVFTVMTPKKNQMVWSDKKKTITIQDQNNNKIVMSDSEINMSSQKNITIDAAQKLTLKGKTGVSIESSGGDIQEKGLNIKATAQVQYAAKGSTKAEVQGGAQLTLKGAMVMIN